MEKIFVISGAGEGTLRCDVSTSRLRAVRANEGDTSGGRGLAGYGSAPSPFVDPTLDVVPARIR